MNVFEEIQSIWTQQLLNDKTDAINSEVVMNLPGIFMPNSVEWRISKPGHWYIETQFDPLIHQVYQIEVTTLGNGIARYRWVNPSYVHKYHKNNFEYQIDDRHIKEFYTDYSPDKILDHANDAVNGTMLNNNDKEEWYETIELDMTDAEIALIARAAHAQDITINEFMNNVIKAELDSVMPEWREEMKKGV